jgi:hypothetical protein
VPRAVTEHRRRPDRRDDVVEEPIGPEQRRRTAGPGRGAQELLEPGRFVAGQEREEGALVLGHLAAEQRPKEEGGDRIERGARREQGLERRPATGLGEGIGAQH